MIEKTVTDGVSTVFERAQEMKPCPEGMSEEAVSIGHCFVASRMYVLLGGGFSTTGSDRVTN